MMKLAEEFDTRGAEPLIHSLINALSIEKMVIVGLRAEYHSPSSSILFFSSGVDNCSLKNCFLNSSSSESLIDCIEKKCLEIRGSSAWHKCLISLNGMNYFVFLTRKEPLKSYEKLLVHQLLTHIIVSRKVSDKLDSRQQLTNMLLNFLALVAPIGHLNVTIEKVLSLVANLFRESFGLIYAGIRFSFNHETKFASSGELLSKCEVVNLLSLSDTGIMSGSIDGVTWILAAYREHDITTELVILSKNPILDENKDFINAVLLLSHMVISNYYQRLRERFQIHKLRRNFRDTLSMIKYIVDMRDSYTENHSEGVAKFARKIGELMGLDEKKLERLELAGLLHDIGKIGVPEAILLKPIGLNSREKRIIQLHSEFSAKILQSYSEFWDLVPWVRHHHERWDGKGYPEGLKGEEIPLEARILSVADAIEAMSSDRVYRNAPEFCKVRIKHTLLQEAGKQWDPEIARLAADHIDEIISYSQQNRPKISDDRMRRYRMESAHSWLLYSTAKSMSRVVKTAKNVIEMVEKSLKAIAKEFQYSAVSLMVIKKECELREIARVGKDYFEPINRSFSGKSVMDEVKRSIERDIPPHVRFKLIELRLVRDLIGLAFVARENRNITAYEKRVVALPLTFLMSTYLSMQNG